MRKAELRTPLIYQTGPKTSAKSGCSCSICENHGSLPDPCRSADLWYLAECIQSPSDDRTSWSVAWQLHRCCWRPSTKLASYLDPECRQRFLPCTVTVAPRSTRARPPACTQAAAERVSLQAAVTAMLAPEADDVVEIQFFSQHLVKLLIAVGSSPWRPKWCPVRQ